MNKLDLLFDWNMNYIKALIFISFLVSDILFTVSKGGAMDKTANLAKSKEYWKVQAEEKHKIKKESQKEIGVLNHTPKTSGNPDIAVKTSAENSESAIDRVLTDKKIVALTFDADMTYGMENDLKNGRVESWYNESLIKELEKTQTPATLFLTGLWIKNYPEETKKLAANPLFEIGNHSYSHPGFAAPCYKLPVIPNNLDKEEISKTDELLKKHAPNYKKYFRFPGLCHDNSNIDSAKKLGYKVIDGDVKGLDGFTRDAGGIVSRVVSRVKPGSIIILHMHGGPNAPATGKALPEIIRQIKEKGYEFVKISELLENY